MPHAFTISASLAHICGSVDTIGQLGWPWITIVRLHLASVSIANLKALENLTDDDRNSIWSQLFVTQWCCVATAPGTLGDTRHLLDLVSLGTWIEGFEQNREELNVYHLLSYYLLKHSRCQVPDIKHHVVTITNSPYHQFFSSSTSVQAKQ